MFLWRHVLVLFDLLCVLLIALLGVLFAVDVTAELRVGAKPPARPATAQTPPSAAAAAATETASTPTVDPPSVPAASATPSPVSA